MRFVRESFQGYWTGCHLQKAVERDPLPGRFASPHTAIAPDCPTGRNREDFLAGNKSHGR